jgi:threonine synthase
VVRANKHILGLRCFRCGKEHDVRRAHYVCPACAGNLDVVYDYKAVSRRLLRSRLSADHDRSVWRYAELLPTARPSGVPFVHVGWTPLYRAERLGRSLGLTQMWLKDDTRNPSASFKDRAGIAAVAKALQLGRRVITGASTGNAASSLACLCASTGVRPIVFVPRTAPPAKITQLLVFGAAVVAVRGTYDQAFDLCLKASELYGWYNRNTGYNPYTREGKKTCSFEIAEQLGWKVPDKVFVPVGDGNILTGVWKGWLDLYAVGLIRRLPQLVAVQAEGSNAVKKAFESDGALRPVSGRTLADSISVSLPRDGEAAVRALRESKGFAVEVSDAEILDAMRLLARTESVFAEPAGAAAAAGLKKAVLQGKVRRSESVVALATGSGLKDIASASRAVDRPFCIDPDVAELKKLVRGFKGV